MHRNPHRYNMILNLLRVEELRVEDMMRRSFYESSNQRESADLQASLEDSKVRLEAAESNNVEETEDIEEFYRVSCDILMLRHAVQEGVLSSSASLKVLTAGRVVVVNNNHYRNALAVVLKAEKPRRREHVSLHLPKCLTRVPPHACHYFCVMLTVSSRPLKRTLAGGICALTALFALLLTSMWRIAGRR